MPFSILKLLTSALANPKPLRPGFRVQGSGFRVLGFWGSGVHGLGFWGLGFRV